MTKGRKTAPWKRDAALQMIENGASWRMLRGRCNWGNPRFGTGWSSYASAIRTGRRNASRRRMLSPMSRNRNTYRNRNRMPNANMSASYAGGLARWVAVARVGRRYRSGSTRRASRGTSMGSVTRERRSK
jgi:hypothetical protein